MTLFRFNLKAPNLKALDIRMTATWTAGAIAALTLISVITAQQPQE